MAPTRGRRRTRKSIRGLPARGTRTSSYPAAARQITERMTMATTVKPGDRGDLVTKLQAALIRFGYDLGPAGADGSFGDLTKVAVESFQGARDLPATGVADPETIAAMDLDPDTLDDLIEIEGQGGATGEAPASPVGVAAGGERDTAH